MKRTVAVVLSVSILSLGAWANARESRPSHDQAVMELFRITRIERTMMGGATAMVDAQIQANPAIAPYRGVMLEWAGKYLTWEAMAPELLKIYKEAFTESEVREMITFYRTRTGQKALAKMPELMQKGAAVGVSMAQAHSAELEKMVSERKKQIEAGESKR